MKENKKGVVTFIKDALNEGQARRDALVVARIDRIVRGARPDVSEEEIPALRRRAIETPTVPSRIRRRWQTVVDRHEARQQQAKDKI